MICKKDIGIRIGFVRNKAGFSAKDLSILMGLSEQYVSKVENGEFNITLNNLLKLLDLCKFPAERFFADNFIDYNIDVELGELIKRLPKEKKEYLIKLLK